MTIEIPKGEGVVELIYQQTLIEIIGNSLSMVAIILLIIGIIFKRIHSKK